MRKKFIYMLIMFIIALILLFVLYKYQGSTSLFSKNIYTYVQKSNIDINTLKNSIFYENNIISYNDQKLICYDVAGQILWENEKNEFSDSIYISNNIYRVYGNNVEMYDYEGNKQDIIKIDEQIISIQSQKDKTIIITETNNKNSLYILEYPNELVLNKKDLENRILSVSVSDKSESFILSSFYVDNGLLISELEFNLINGTSFWKMDLKDEIVIETYYYNNNIFAITDKNIYLINAEGKLLRKDSISKLLDYDIDHNKENIYLLVENEANNELIEVIEGKIKKRIMIPSEFNKLKLIEDKIYVFNNKTVTIVNNGKVNLLWNSKEDILDFYVLNHNMYMLFTNKLICGEIISK